MTRLNVLEHRILYKDEHYNSFPNAVVMPDGRWLVGFRQAPDRTASSPGNTHIDPKSRAVYIVSENNGDTWSAARTLYDDYCFGVQDPCLNVLRDGTLLCTFFTWQLLLKSDVAELNPRLYDRIVGKKYVARLGGAFSLRSQDSGLTWDEPLPITDEAGGIAARNIRGNTVELEDGTILLPMYYRTPDHSSAHVVMSWDGGRTWQPRSSLPQLPEFMFHEPNLFRTAGGKLLALLRTTDGRDGVPQEEKHPLYTCESLDDGRTWGNLRRHSLYSPSPFHMLQLRSGHVLLTFGHRHPAYGIHACLLDGECERLGEAPIIVLRSDGLGKDIGYTSAVQLAQDDIWITYYYYDEDGNRHIAATRCREDHAL